MYRQHFGLLHKPFELAPDAGTLFLSESHREALSVLRYGVVANKGFLVLTGGIGTGKTTLVNVLAASLDCPHHLCVLSNPTLEIADFYYYLASKLELPFDGNKAKFLILFSRFIEKCRQEQRRVLLIFDEAHALPFELFQEIRFLANLPPEDQVALSIFLIGQPELLDRLADERLLPLRQRVAIRFHIEPLSMDDTREYIFFRLERAGAVRRKLFTEKALELIHQATGGNPRLINILCDNALVSAFAADALVIDEAVIRACTDELAIPGEQATFSLPRPDSRMRPVWIAAGIAILAAMGLGLYLAYTNG